MQVDDLLVYQKLFRLALEVHHITLSFPKFELYELGSQLRRSSNSAPANLAEGFGSKHTNVYVEGISRARGEIRETIHHLKMVQRKDYISEEKCNHFVSAYEECSKMLHGLQKALIKNK